MIDFIALSIFFFGAIIGSFLNALIYRLPRHISLLNPKRSFCPSCTKILSWWENIPLLSWLLLRGRCSQCHAFISWRYPCVEVITAFLFCASYFLFGFPLVIAFWVFISLLIIATFIDLEHLLIPDEITIGGIILGIMASCIFPELMDTTHRGTAILISAGSAIVAYFLLWGILEIGKLTLGQKTFRSEQPQFFELKMNEGVLQTYFQGEQIFLEDILLRSSDYIKAKAFYLKIGEEEYRNICFEISGNKIKVNNRFFRLEEIVPLHAEVLSITFPCEAMGFGDVKFLAAIAAFLGIKGMLFSLFGGSVLGAIAGSLMLLCTQGRVGRKVPFGPYLALGALIWLLASPAILKFYGLSF